MGQRAKRLTEDQRRAARQAASDALCAAIGVESFTLPDHVDVPPSFSPLTSPLWPIWSALAYRCAEHTHQPGAPRRTIGINFNPLAWAKRQRQPV